MNRLFFISILSIWIGSAGSGHADPAAENAKMKEKLSTGDPDIMAWTEEVLGEKALAWVRSQNERSLSALQSEPVYPELLREAEAILTSKERIPYGRVRDGVVYNFWQDENHVRGLWRKTPLESYAMENPQWETVLDVDQLARDEGKNWVFKGANVFQPHGEKRYVCLIALSDGGKDAVVNREFDLASKSFVEDGFVTPEAKQRCQWVDPDTLLVGTDWGDDSLTESGYPMKVKRWKRGTPLSEAVEVICGRKTDVGTWPMVLKLEDGILLQGASQADTFFTSTYWLFSEGEAVPVRWPLPPKCDIEGTYLNQLLVSLKQDWIPEGQSQEFLSGDLVSLDVVDFVEKRTLPQVSLVFRPSSVQAVNGVSIARNAALLSINDNVVTRLLRLEFGSDHSWRTEEIALPGKGTAYVAFADREESVVFLGYDDFLTPESLFSYDLESGQIRPLKSLPAKFDAGSLKVEQDFAISADGTKIPYFLVCGKDIPLDGSTPLLLYGYGGFEISMRPSYPASTGKLWLEKGGAYVVANIRGGGEFGPNWHQAGLKTNRQRIYSDFIAVAETLIERKVTSPARLGIMGGSNGGLLMGVMLTQRPDLWNALVVQVPLLDMLRYHHLLAGASWVDEYGSPDVPEERAFLETISPVHNFKPGEKKYPVPFFVTSTKDDRVHPAHARKMGVLFEQAGLPFYYYENIDGGHSAAANQLERAKRNALEFTYLIKQLF